MPSHLLSTGETGTSLYADLISILANKAPFPSAKAAVATWSTDIYDIEDQSGLIASFMLSPSGNERSVINLDFPSWYFWGLPQNGLYVPLGLWPY